MSTNPSRFVKPPRWIKPMNRVLLAIRSAGGLQELSVLTVVGRRSGKPRRTPLSVLTFTGDRYLLEGFPGADWAQNVRAARGEAELTTGRTTERVHLTELDAHAAIPILRAWPEKAGTDGPKIMKSAGVIDEITPEAFEGLAGRCGVFRVDAR